MYLKGFKYRYIAGPVCLGAAGTDRVQRRN